MSKNTENLFFEGKLRDYENTIIEYYKERADFTGQSNTLSTIIGYLSIHGRLTQTQLKKLTGFSKSTISTGLSNLINVRYIKKEKITGKREYEYYLSFNSQDSIDDALGTVELEINFFKEKIRELETKFTERHKGYDLLLTRLIKILEVFEIYQNSLKNLTKPNESILFNCEQIEAEVLTAKDIDYLLEDLDPEIKGFENSLIDFFKYQSAYSTLKDYMLIVFVYFITRKVLTQGKIKTLTGLSVGKISEVVNYLIKKGHIIRIDKEKYRELIPKELERQKIYGMLSIKESFFVSGIKSLDEMLKWENKFVSINAELNSRKGELELLHGYQKIKTKVNEFITLMSIYKNARNVFFRLLS
ncbi:MAG: hypothetical protein ACFFAO_14945 [Candidatus Hermodarchaeota archaeon]